MLTTNERRAKRFTTVHLMRCQQKFYNNKTVLSVILLSLVLLSGSVRSELSTGTDEVAQLPYWEWKDDTVSIRLVQRLPDQSRGYFEARGFNKEHAEIIAQNCVFQTVYKNIAEAGTKHVVSYDLSKWQVIVDGRKQSMKLREYWDKEWRRLGVSSKAMIAFKWSLLPTKQSYKAQDFNWGMSIYGIKPGTRFDLLMVWQTDNETSTATIKNIECAPDVHMEPKDAFG